MDICMRLYEGNHLNHYLWIIFWKGNSFLQKNGACDVARFIWYLRYYLMEKQRKPQFADERKKNTHRSAFDKRLIWSPALLQRTSIVKNKQRRIKKIINVAISNKLWQVNVWRTLVDILINKIHLLKTIWSKIFKS